MERRGGGEEDETLAMKKNPSIETLLGLFSLPPPSFDLCR